MPMSVMAISVSDFVKRYRSVTVAHENLVLSARVTLLIGGNGSGKTTLLKAMAGLIVYEGSIQGGHCPFYVEESVRFPDDMRVRTYLDCLLRLGGGDPHRLRWLLETLAMDQRLEDVFKHLSKGMKQKVNLIQALMAPRALYLLDEPFSGLDKASRRQLVDIIRTTDAFFVCATHQVGEFERLIHEKVYL